MYILKDHQTVIEATSCTPYVLIDSEQGVIRIIGKSNSESASDFYQPIMTYLERATRSITINFELVDLSISAIKCIFSMLKLLEKLDQNGLDLLVRWVYEEDDADMLGIGERFQVHLNIPIILMEAA